jgi:uncharacterized protein (DUF4415 family)
MTVNKGASRKRSKKTDDAPELTKAWFATADLHDGARLVRRGRPKGSGSKELVSLRLDKEALATLRATGPGWQVRINDTVVRYARRLVKRA